MKHLYQSDLKLDPNIWNWADAKKDGLARLHEMDAEGIRPPGTEGAPAEETHYRRRFQAGYQPIHTAEELLAPKNSSGKYILMHSISLWEKGCGWPLWKLQWRAGWKWTDDP